MPYILWNPQYINDFIRTRLLFLSFSYTNILHAFLSRFFKIHYNINTPSIARTLKYSVSLMLSDLNPVKTYLLPRSAMCPANLVLIWSLE